MQARSAQLLAVVLLANGALSGATLNSVFTTTEASDDFCNPGPRSSTFLTTDSHVWLYVSMSANAVGDELTVTWIRPGNVIYHTTEFAPLSAGGNYCFDAGIHIAGNAAAQFPGTWKIEGYYNGAPLFNLNFTLQGPGGGGTSENLIVNPGAEDGPGTLDAVAAATVPGWTINGPVGVMKYSSTEIPSDAPGPPDRGANHFAGGPGNGLSSLTQRISVSSRAALIDAANYPFTLSGWLGGWNGQDDNARVTITFRNAAGAALGTATIGPVSSADRGGVTALLERTATGTVPATTRFIDVELRFERVEGSYNDGLADNLSLLLGVGGGGTRSGVYYRFENGAAGATATGANSILDSVSPGQHGTPSGAVTYSSDVAQATLGSSANARSLSFASSGKVTFAGVFPLNTLTDATLEFYIKTGNAGEMDFLWTRSDGTDANRFNMGVLGSGSTQRVFLDYRTPAGVQHIVAPSIPLTANAWTHVAVVKRGNVWTSYSNGIQAGQPVTDTNPSLPTNTGWTFNGRGSVSFTGLLDEFRITPEALAPAQFLPAAGGGGGPCNYLVNPLTSSVGFAGGTGLVLVTTAPGCAWTAASNAAWITIEAGSSGSGSGAVSYRAAANTATSTRTGSLTIAGQTHTVTQAAAPACSYSLSTNSASVPAAGGPGGVLLNVTGSGCSWTAMSNVPWITITAGTSGSASTTVTYTVAANAATTARSGTLTLAGLTYTVTQAGAPPADQPQISQGGVVNAASYTPATLEAGAIARGSFFSIFGVNIGPAQFQQQTTYPLPQTLGQVTVTIRKGATSVQAYLVFVSATQINGILPSNAPAGDVEVIVTYRGNASAPLAVKVVDSNFGIFTTAAGRGPGIIQNFVSATELPLNTRTASAKPGQVEVLLGTGLGPVAVADNQTPPVANLPVDVEVTVGGKIAQVLYKGRMPGVAGVDQINFVLPADVAVGCYVPVQIKVGATYSNTVTMAIHINGAPCEDPYNPFSALSATGGRTGEILLIRANIQAQLEAGQPPLDILLDLGLAQFQEFSAASDLGFNPLFSLPPVGSCSAYSGSVDFGALLGGDPGSATPGGTSLLGRALDAGPQLMVTGPLGSIPLPKSEEVPGPYLGLLGGAIPIEGTESLPPFLNGGAYSVTGPGGADVGPFTANITIGAPIAWTNRDATVEMNRSAGLPLTWSGGDASKLVIIGGVSAEQESGATAGFFCFVPAAPGNFTVPASVLANLPGGAEALGVVIVGSVPTGNVPTFSASGIEKGVLVNVVLFGKTVTVR